MTAPVYLIAGAGPETGPRSFRFHDDVVAARRKARPLYAYVGAASGDARWFERIIKTMLFGPRSSCAFIRLTDKSLRTSEAKSMLGDADTVFVSGDDVEAAMRVIEDRGLSPFFRELHALARLTPNEAGKCVCGLTSKCAGLWDGKKLRALGGPLARVAWGTSRKVSDLMPE